MGPLKSLGPEGVYPCPLPQAAMVDEPIPPARTLPPGPWTTTGTLLTWMFSRTKLPAVGGLEFVVQAVLIAMGTLVKLLSKTVMEPVSTLLGPPAEMSMPTWQLLIERPWYVHPQFQSWIMALECLSAYLNRERWLYS